MHYQDNIYGANEISGIFEELINTRVFQRLKRIHQGGPIFLVNAQMKNTRYDHSMGVMLLIRRLGGSREAQIAGLLHDVSHTAFSHLIDYLLEIEEEDYHEQRYAEVMADPELLSILNQYGYHSEEFLDLEQYRILEYPLPALSADRIDYTLRDLFQLGVLNRSEIDWFLEGLTTFEERIVVKSKAHGLWFQSKYEYLIQDYFKGKENRDANRMMKKIAKESLEQGIIEVADFHQDDFHVIDKIQKGMSIELEKWINEMIRMDVPAESVKNKNRYIDPEVLIGGQISKLSQIQ